MIHERNSLLWIDASPKQARDILMRNGISSGLFTEARKRFTDETWPYGPSLYLIDSLTDKGARVTIQGPDEFDVKVSSRTGEALLSDITEQAPALVDHLVIMD